MGSALLNPAAALDSAKAAKTVAAGLFPVEIEDRAMVPETVGDLRLQVAAHLAAHRGRRAVADSQPRPDRTSTTAPTRSARIAAAVAERYAQTPSYRTFLAAEAERATQQALAAAQVAAQNAQAVAAAQQRLLAAYEEQIGGDTDSPPAEAVALQLWPEADKEPVPSPMPSQKPAPHPSVAPAAAAVPLTVRLYEDEERPMRAADRFQISASRPSFPAGESAAEAMVLDDEIAFRHAPVFEEATGPAVALPANLIEFPRQLVAARKARPRYAEGPLRQEADAAPGDGQLRIFEVDPAQICIAPEEAGPGNAQWSSIWLDAPAQVARASNGAGDEALEDGAASAIEPASFARRGMAAAVNGAVVAAGMVAFATAAVAVVAHWSGVPLRTGLPAVAGLRQIVAGVAGQTQAQARDLGMVAAVSGAVLLLVYHALFFFFSTATPGMRCVRIALCTFAGESPARRAVRRRTLAALLSALPLGMGYAWAALDEDRLTWHDRISRMYLRRY